VGAPERLSILEGEALREPLRAALGARTVMHAPLSSSTASAVLVPLVVRDGEAHVWLVRRASTLRRHSGQVAFPGGKKDATDESTRFTALREAHEEIGLPGDDVDVLGRLDDLVTGTGFTISPFVGWVATAFTPIANTAEVARVFAAPLRTFFAPRHGIPPFRGHTVDGELVWGATGKMLRDLVAVVRTIETATIS
jgi:8-oxo-dGTP pyrophosphatase MutT (NUDIX family)